MTATIEDFANTIAEYENLAIKSGEWDGIDAPEFSDDGITWSQVWPAGETPAFARATVYRKGVRAPHVAVIAWAESLPAAEEWRVLWERKPMTLFGSSAKRSAIRHAFRDVVGDRRDADEFDPSSPSAPSLLTPPRDWSVDIARCSSVEELDQVWKDARAARARTAALEVQHRTLRDYLVEREAGRAPAGIVLNAHHLPVAEVRADGTIADTRAIEDPEPAEEPRRAAPQDHLPPADGNRAARRARKKGARRGR